MRGKRTVHNAGLLLFLAGALSCALAPNFGALIVSRVLQGIGASMYQATNMALVVSLVHPENRGRALGIVSTFVAMGTILGPSVGGILVQWMSWQANFWILAGVSAFLWILAHLAIPKDRPVSDIPLDAVGAGLFGTWIGSLIVLLNMGTAWGWQSPYTVAIVLLFTASGALFVAWCRPGRWEKSGGLPFLRIGLFRNPMVRLGISITITTYLAAFAAQLVLPIFLREQMGLKPAWVGFILVTYPLALLITSPISGELSDRIGSSKMMTLGLGLMAIVLTALSFLSRDSSLAFVLCFVTLLGSSMGMVTSPTSSFLMGQVAKDEMSFVSSLIALSRNIGMMFGSVLGGTFSTLGANGGRAFELFRVDPAVFGYRSVFFAAAVCVFLVVASQIRLVRKQTKMKSGTLSA